MKRSPMPPRKKPLRSGSAPQRSASISKISDRRRSQQATRRDIVRDAVRAGVCLARPLGNCGGGLVGHEIVKRSQARDAHINRDLVIAVCSVHNGWVEDHPVDAQRMGLSVPGWAWRRDGQRALDEARRLRERAWLGREPGWPYWLDPVVNDALT